MPLFFKNLIERAENVTDKGTRYVCVYVCYVTLLVCICRIRHRTTPPACCTVNPEQLLVIHCQFLVTA